MDHVVHRKLSDLNPHFKCVLCEGYLVDATTIIECLHSFCKTCIMHHLENSAFCPICDVQVHKTKPLQSIRSDNTLQDIVYKLVPGLYQSEMKRRRELYAKHPGAAADCSPEERGEGADQRPIHIYTPDETISLSLEYLTEENNPINAPECEENSTESKEKSSESKEKSAESEEKTTEPEEKQAEPEQKDPQKRYLRCPAAISIGHLKKFISMKFGLPASYAVEIVHHDNILSDNYTLVDIAYKYAWKRAEPMQFFYNITRRRVIKRIKPVNNLEKIQQLSSMKEEAVLTENSASTCDPTDESSEPKQKLQKIEEKSADSSISLPAETSQKDIVKPDCVEAMPAVLESSTTDNKVPVSSTDSGVKINSSLNETLPSSEVAPVPCNAAKTLEANLTANGVTLKFVQHHPPVEQAKSRGRKPAGKRAGGRTSRYKGNTRAPLVRLAPYPPPNSAPPVTCLTTSPMTHLNPITVRNLVNPAVTGLPTTLMTTLRPQTVSTLCNSTMNSMIPSNPQVVATHSPFRGYQPPSTPNFIPQTVNTSSPVVPPRFPSITTSGFVPTSETGTSLRPATSDIPSNVLTSQALPTSQNNISMPIMQSQSQVHVKATANPILQTSSNFVTHAVTMSANVAKAFESPNVNLAVMVPDVTSVTSISSITISPAIVSKPVTAIVSKPVTATLSKSVTATVSKPVTANIPVLPPIDKSDIPVVPIIIPSSARTCSNEVPNSVKGNKQELCKTGVSDVPASEQLLTTYKKEPKPVLSITNLPESVAISSASEIKSNTMSNGIKSHQDKSPLKDGLAFPRTFTIEKKSEDFPFKITVVKNSISAEFSDNDDLGCQPDLVVDEQKLDSSDNEDDDALRKKITAIAEKDDEADVTDDTEADSGRASDISSQARSSCDDDVGSPMMTIDVERSSTSTTLTSTSSTPAFTSHLPPFTTPVQTPSTVSIAPAAEENHRPPTKSIGLDHVISNLYRNHEKKDNIGALDLSTCLRKQDEESPRSRQKAVANPPVLDVKHRQQTCLSAPKQHTACVPTPKHPTSSNLHLAGMAHHTLINAAAAASTSALHKSLQLPVPYTPLAFPCHVRTSSSPMIGRSTPNYSMSSGMMVPNAHQTMQPMVPHPCMGPPMNTFPGWHPVPPAPLPAAQGRSTPCASPRRNDSSPVPNSQNNHKVVPPTTKQSCTPPSSNAHHRKASLNSDCERHASKSPSSRNGSATDSSPISHTHKAPSARSSPNPIGIHSSSKSTFSPTTTSPLVNNVTSTTSASATSSSYKLSQPTIPIYKKSNSSYKNHGYSRFKNLQVINPDPNGIRNKIVIRNLDFKPHHQSQRL